MISSNILSWSNFVLFVRHISRYVYALISIYIRIYKFICISIYKCISYYEYIFSLQIFQCSMGRREYTYPFLNIKNGSQNVSERNNDIHLDNNNIENSIHLLLCRNCLSFLESNFFNLINTKEKKNAKKEIQFLFLINDKGSRGSDAADITSLLHEVLGRLFFCMDTIIYE